MLSNAQIEQYHRDGYLGVEGVFPLEQVEALLRVTEEFVEQSRGVTQHTEVFDLDPAHSSENPCLRRIKQPAHQHPAYMKALRHAPMLDMVAQLIGPNLRYQNTKLNLKASGNGPAVEWHQDLAGYPHTNESILAVGLALDDMRVENGALMVLPGSHTGPVFDHNDQGRYVAAITDPRFSDANAVPIELKAGGISIHHGRMVHGSTPNRSNKPRRLLLFELRATDSWPLMGIGDWDEFNAMILRGEPVFEPRMENVPIRLPFPPPISSGSIYEAQQHQTNKALASR